MWIFHAWGSVMGASGYVVRALRFGIRYMPTVPFRDGMLLGGIPQEEEYLEFDGSGEVRHDDIFGHREGVPTFLLTPEMWVLLLVPLRRIVLPVNIIPVCVGKVGFVVREVSEAVSTVPSL